MIKLSAVVIVEISVIETVEKAIYDTKFDVHATYIVCDRQEYELWEWLSYKLVLNNDTQIKKGIELIK